MEALNASISHTNTVVTASGITEYDYGNYVVYISMKGPKWY